jgi:hypothetical protein
MLAKMPPYGSKEFREMRVDMYLRRSFLEESEYDHIAIVIAHELSHLILNSIAHPLQYCEKAVDLTAMLLGFRHLYISGSQKEHHLWRSMEICQIGYLTPQEVRRANQVIARFQPSPLTLATAQILEQLRKLWRQSHLSSLGAKWTYAALGIFVIGVGLLILEEKKKTPQFVSLPIASEGPYQSEAPIQATGFRAAPPQAQIAEIQSRLARLGYLSGRVDGIWGTKSRYALRAFKAANALNPNDSWDENVRAAMFSSNALYAPAPPSR